MRINEQGLGYANKKICREALENGRGVNCYLRRDVAAALGRNDLGLIFCQRKRAVNLLNKS